MKIIQAYNNNIVLAKQENREVILVGVGIGFNKRPHDEVDESKIQKTYTFENAQKKQLNELLERTPLIYFRIAEVIASKASELLKIELSSQILISLSDHICYAVKRKQQNITVPNFMLNEIKSLYKKEFKIGLWALKLIEANTKVKFDEDEAGYIAMHIVNATISEKGSHHISKILRFIKDVQRIIESTFSIVLDEKELNYSRFITHLKFLGQHIFLKEKNKNETLPDLYAFLIKQDERMEQCIQNICECVLHNYHYSLEENEQVYLMIHISKLIH